MANWRVIEGDCVEVLRAMPEASVDAVVTDPPYGLNFMGKEWDRMAGHVVRNGSARAVGDDGGRHDEGYRNMRGQERAFQAWCEAWAREALRVLKPGGHLLAFGGTRTYHRLTCAIEDAGFEIRDEVLSVFETTEAGRQFLASLSPAQLKALDALGGGPLAWLYGSGFPKSLDAERTVAVATCPLPGRHFARTLPTEQLPGDHVCPATSESVPWSGFGSALKPAHEPIVLARKPLAGTVAGNVLAHGTGALNVDGCRIGWGAEGNKSADRKAKGYSEAAKKALGGVVASESATGFSGEVVGADSSSGRWPANVVLSHTETCVEIGTRRVKSNSQAAERHAGPETALYGAGLGAVPGAGYGSGGMETVAAWECAPDCPVRLLDEQTGELGLSFFAGGGPRVNSVYGPDVRERAAAGYGDSGGASRFFYVAKASSAERNAGLDAFEAQERDGQSVWAGLCKVCGCRMMLNGKPTCGHDDFEWVTGKATKNRHPTVKPIDLMRWLVRLATPPGGTVLDPFAGSGTTGIAAVFEGFGFVGIEREAEYVEIARARIEWWEQHPEGVEIVEALRAERKRSKIAEAGQMGFAFDADPGGTGSE